MVRKAFYIAPVLWALVIAACMCAPAPVVSATEVPVDDGRLPGDDIPATTRCYMTPEEIAADWAEVEAEENLRIEQALLAKAHKLTNVTVTHYDPCIKCCSKTDGITASGRKGTPYVTVAVDPRVIPLGSDVLVDYGDGEIHYYRADDTGNGVAGNHIDLFVESHQEARELGLRKATVYWIQEEI